MNQGKLEVVKQEMARVNIDILGTSELKWTEMGNFNSDDHYIYYCGQESLRRNGVTLIVNKRVLNAVLGCNLKNNRLECRARRGGHVPLFGAFVRARVCWCSECGQAARTKQGFPCQ